MNLDGRLVVSCSRVDLGLAGRDGRVAVDHLRHDTTERLNAERQRGDVEQQNALNIASENAALNSCAHGNNLIGVDRHVRLLARDGLDEFLHGRHTGGATDQDDLVDLAGRVASVLQRLLDRLAATIEQVAGDALELGARQRVVEVLRAGSVSSDERQVDVGLRDGRQLDLGLLGSFLQALQSHLVGAQVDAVLGLELVGKPVDDALVPVVAAQMVVASGGSNLEHAVAQLEDGHVEGAAAQVEDEDLLIVVDLVKAVGKRGGDRKSVV